MSNLRRLLVSGGFRARVPASQAAIAEIESAFGIVLPPQLAELWTISDGMDGDGIDLLSVASAQEYAEISAGGLCYVPFTDCQDSNPYAVAAREPLRGGVVHIFHDDQATLTCRGIDRFVDLVVDARRRREPVDMLVGDYDFASPDRTTSDVFLAQDLMRAAEAMDQRDDHRTLMLRFAIQLLGRGQEADLGEVMNLGDEYTRADVRQRWNALDTPAARKLLQDDTVAFDRFVVALQRAFEAEGIQTKPDRQRGFRLLPGKVGLNFAMIYADCRRGGAMDEWVRRFTGRR